MSQGDTVYEMEGWAWNDNLGWVSFSCDGTTHLNRDAECGNQTYGVTLKYNSADNSLSFSGYAWNDATGYISMHNTNHGGDIPYGVRMDSYGTFINDYTLEYDRVWAWSESIKWINFAGVSGNLTILNVLGCEDTGCVGVCPEICDSKLVNCDEDIKTAFLGELPVADGVDKYTIRLNFRDVTGAPLSKADLDANYDIRVFVNWTDTVKRNQITGPVAGTALKYLKSPITDNTGGVLYKPVFVYNLTASSSEFPTEYGAPSTIDTTNSDDSDTSASGKVEWLNDSLVLSVKSLAPTSGGNKSKVVSYVNKNVFRDNDPGVSGEKNNLKLESISWILQNKTTLRRIVGSTPCGSLPLNFKPALTVDKLNTVSKTDTVKDTLVLYRNVPSMIEVMGGLNTWIDCN